MSTTMICTSAGIGLGIMAQTIERNVESIDKLIICNYPNNIANTKVSFSKSKNKLFFNLNNNNEILNELKKMSDEKDRKFFYIETSWGLSSYLNYNSNFYMPMWEQGSTYSECKNSKNVISITKKTINVVKSLGFNSEYIPYPIEMNENYFQPKKNVKNILHNAGSLGGNLRKGTIESIKIFQKSKLSKLDKKLIIHSWKDPTIEIIEQIKKDEENIIWRKNFFDEYQKIYENFDLLLFPSKLEGHAMVALEAMSCGLPVLCTDEEPMNEYENDKNYKISVQSKQGNYSFVDCNEGAEKLRKICLSDISKKSVESFEFVKSNMSWGVLKEKYNSYFG